MKHLWPERFQKIAEWMPRRIWRRIIWALWNKKPKTKTGCLQPKIVDESSRWLFPWDLTAILQTVYADKTCHIKPLPHITRRAIPTIHLMWKKDYHEKAWLMEIQRLGMGMSFIQSKKQRHILRNLERQWLRGPWHTRPRIQQNQLPLPTRILHNRVIYRKSILNGMQYNWLEIRVFEPSGFYGETGTDLTSGWFVLESVSGVNVKKNYSTRKKAKWDIEEKRARKNWTWCDYACTRLTVYTQHARTSLWRLKHARQSQTKRPNKRQPPRRNSPNLQSRKRHLFRREIKSTSRNESLRIWLAWLNPTCRRLPIANALK